ncbi:MAG TPA: phosphoribosylglycinamide synthetase C domain-containing protein, partial [Myxococcaceae bacterium]|nr:phosphoribosylglycinamide synthetase C domain-containing protein [Myxococcaceae bacterium]
LAAEGYPEAPKKGAVIRGLDDAQPDQGAVFLAGVGAQGGALVTTGGRVLTVCARGATLEAARQSAYEAAGAIRFDGMQLRRDIGWRVLRAS